MVGRWGKNRVAANIDEVLVTVHPQPDLIDPDRRRKPSTACRKKTPAARGDRLIDALIVWITSARPLQPGINRFEAWETGDMWIERLSW